MSIRPRIPRNRAPVIPLYSRARWYESTHNRVVAIIVLATFGGVIVHAALAWWGAS